MRKVGIRIDTIPYLGQRTEDHRRIDRLGAELITDEHKSKQEQEGVDTHHPIGEGVGRAAEHGIEYDRETGDRTNDQMTRHQEIINGSSTKAHTNGHHQQFPPELNRT